MNIKVSDIWGEQFMDEVLADCRITHRADNPSIELILAVAIGKILKDMKETKEKSAGECTCDKRQETKICPYSLEMDDKPKECNCCPYCQEQCRLET